ncbi:hypothetical protein [Motilimonas eburnea]|uniref:hypothetical protein n=1 Tax=Motilimonas eburnea TaxID=1737488 RepID=UPI001E3AA876|nr:hypothetical protein [Motilimonas eburnea]MCE2572716.1 hypothetical protein [Motilimonas eburnea]
MRYLLLASLFMIQPVQAELIFADDFEGHPDWVAGFTNPDNPTGRPHSNPPPQGWYALRTDPARAPSMGDLDRHESIEIKTAPEKARSGVKSAQFYRDALSTPDWKWWSDGILAKKFDQDYEQLYASFYIKWQPNSPHPASLSKLFRITHTEGSGHQVFRNFHDGFNGPTAGWMYVHNDYGLRNTIMMRGYPPMTNYYFEEGGAKDLPRNIHNGDMSLNWNSNLTDLNRDGIDDNPNTSLRSWLNDELIPGNYHEGIISPQDLFGDSNKTGWRRIQFFVKMNSAPGVADGIMEQWIDGQQVFANYQIPWVGASATAMVGWNLIKVGGNDYINKKLDDNLRFEDWYAIDDIEVHTLHPHTPIAPANFTVEKL